MEKEKKSRKGWFTDLTIMFFAILLSRKERESVAINPNNKTQVDYTESQNQERNLKPRKRFSWAVFTNTLLSAVTVGILIWQNSIITEQNKNIAEQNRTIESQTEEMVSQTRQTMQQTEEMIKQSEEMVNQNEELVRQGDQLAKQNGFISGQVNEMKRQNEYIGKQYVQNTRSVNAQITSDLIAAIEEQRNTDSINGLIDADGVWQLPKSLLYRIVVISQALIPYDTIITDNALLYGEYPEEAIEPKKEPYMWAAHLRILGLSVLTRFDTLVLSPERGVLLLALIDAKVKFPLNPNPNFEYAWLPRAQLGNTNLHSVNLKRADLRRASLSRADLTNANLFGASLHQAHIQYAKFQDTDFRKAKLNFTHFSGDLVGSVFDSALLVRTEFSNAIIRGASFRGAKIHNIEADTNRAFFLERGAILIDSLGEPLPKRLQNPELYK